MGQVPPVAGQEVGGEGRDDTGEQQPVHNNGASDSVDDQIVEQNAAGDNVDGDNNADNNDEDSQSSGSDDEEDDDDSDIDADLNTLLGNLVLPGMYSLPQEDVPLGHSGARIVRLPSGPDAPKASLHEHPLGRELLGVRTVGHVRSQQRRQRNLGDIVAARERGAVDRHGRCRVVVRNADSLLPFYRPPFATTTTTTSSSSSSSSDQGQVIARAREFIFGGQYSADGQLFVSSARDPKIRIYETDGWSLQRSVEPRDVGWSIIDVDMSSDQRLLAYSSWSRFVHLVPLEQAAERDVQIPVALPVSGLSSSCAFAVKFSPDARTLLCGCPNGRYVVVDVETRTSRRHQAAAVDDVNAVAWSDASSNVFFTGADDSFIKAWDVRTPARHVAEFVGHLAGVTHLHSRGDGRHLLSNSKDQTVKLWDMRQAYPYRAAGFPAPNLPPWDYRHGQHPWFVSGDFARTDDCSVMTYRGHAVGRTLIRAYFSPLHASGQRYVYSGSSDALVYIWDLLTGDVVARLPGHTQLCRDVAWHPFKPELVSSSWDQTHRIWTRSQIKKTLPR